MKTKELIDQFNYLQHRVLKLERESVLNKLQKKLTPLGLEIKYKTLNGLGLEVQIDGEFSIYAGDENIFTGDTEDILVWIEGYKSK